MGQLRGSEYDATVLSLFVDGRDVDFVAQAAFDGAYTYFAARGFTEGTNVESWQGLHARMAAHGKIFVPSVGPGYNDTLIRPWNGPSTRERASGGYYDAMWRHALDTSTSMITITSFNEWGEGTQIEAARPHATADGAAYADYGPHGGSMYMDRTAEWVRTARRERGCDDDGARSDRVEL
jgi:glycoprotein endo-alpha-1,2-mannosidase